ncbi:MAG: branched-chain amino acid ABC transporter permease [Syntrophobacterales bacterium]|nr:branched-chain amino acid ABC transporter permease [Syntrophobacterales bacterium]
MTVWLAAALLALVPLVVRNPYQLGLLNLIGIYAVAVLGLNLFIGYAGQISLGHAGFFGLGAYGSALLTVHGWLPPWPALLVTAALMAGAALLLGIPTLRLHGHYLAMATLGFNYIVHLILVQWDQVTGGPSGISGIPPLQVAGFAFDHEARFFYLVWGVVLIGVTLCLNLMRSGVGRGLAALAQDEVAAATLGVNVRREKVRVFVLSAVFASVAGSLYAHYYSYVNPDGFGIFKSLDLVIMVVVGGLGSVWGTLLGVTFVTLLPYYLEFLEAFFDLIHGLILVLILMFLPQGLVTGLWDHLRLAWAKRRLAAKGGTS